ncbi:MAG: DNA alkylation repair protein [Lachnospiraceae bacterium]|nr:DNA alkylation repair protein [Lachnospiraceae bacterium]
MEIITKELFKLQDSEYRDFHSKLMPEISKDKIIGVRTPALRSYAKAVSKEPYAYDFLKELPHTYYEENNLHGALISLMYKDVKECLDAVEEFLPYVDNWATCDMMSPKVFKKDLPMVYDRIKKWIKSNDTYTLRFGIVTLLGFFLDEAFEPEMLKLVSGIKTEEYYVKMAIAWYFSIALVKQYETAIVYFEKTVMEPWIHNKSIQKAIESRRIDEETKNYLRSLKTGRK